VSVILPTLPPLMGFSILPSTYVPHRSSPSSFFGAALAPRGAKTTIAMPVVTIHVLMRGTLPIFIIGEPAPRHKAGSFCEM
jgi:hypothetical protein